MNTSDATPVLDVLYVVDYYLEWFVRYSWPEAYKQPRYSFQTASRLDIMSGYSTGILN